MAFQIKNGILLIYLKFSLLFYKLKMKNEKGKTCNCQYGAKLQIEG